MEVSNELRHGPVSLQLEECVPADVSRGLVRYHHFKVVDGSGVILGHINFRIGDTRHVTLFAGHIGFEILPEHRGHRYSLAACRALAPHIRNYYEQIVITVDPDNAPSRKIIEELGAKFISEVEVPSDDPSYLSGARRKLRYQWFP